MERIGEATGQPEAFVADDDEEAASMHARPTDLLEVLYAQLGEALGKQSERVA